MATSINKKLRQFSKKNNHRLVGFLIETERKNTLQFEGCVRVEDIAKVVDLLKEVMEISARTEGNDEKHDGTTLEKT